MLLEYYALRNNVIPPKFATNGSACFDLHAHLSGVEIIKAYDTKNHSVILEVKRNAVTIPPYHRAVINSGIIFDIPRGFSVRLHNRSGLSLKNGVKLVNQEAVIDHDYIEETMILIENTSELPFYLKNEDRICQGELVRNESIQVRETKRRPEDRNSGRNGGMGSTGA